MGLLKKKDTTEVKAAPAQPIEPVQAVFVPKQEFQYVTAPAPMPVAPMPVAPKLCKKAKKEMKKAAKAAAAQMTFMPIQQVIKKVDDVEAIPQMNESFDYSFTDPLVDGDEITSADSVTISSTGLTGVKNTML